MVTVLAPPPPPPPPHTQALCSIGFGNDTKRPTRVDNEAKACLDQVALNLKQQPDARVVIVADSNAKEKATEAKEQKRAAHNKHAKVENFAAQRAVNAKDYLVTDQGIDASRIATMIGTGDDQSEQNYLVPAGAIFGNDVQGTTPVDETAVKPQERKPLPERHR
jgi:intracellular sulfur oxidation DsrE/DsrF family protein